MPSRKFVPAFAACLVPLWLTVALSSTPSTTQAAPALERRLQITVDALRDAGLRMGAEQGRERLSQQWVLSAVLRSDGTPMPNNPLDPDDGRRQLERAQRTQQRVNAALARQGRSQPTMASAAEMQARAQQIQARCGSDRDCLMREAMNLSAVQVAGADTAVQGRLQAYGAAVQGCERKAATASAREACIANARRQAGAADDDSDRDDEVETPYLHYSGTTRCQLDVSTVVDDRIEGSFQDVQGTVPFTQTTKASHRLRDDTTCPLLQVVLDTRNGRLWAHTAFVMREVPGVTVRSEKGRAPQRSDGNVQLQWREGSDWLQRRLQNLSAAGSDEARLPAGGTGAGGRPDGQLEMRLRWKFDPL
jgi:hypothetical protein